MIKWKRKIALLLTGITVMASVTACGSLDKNNTSSGAASGSQTEAPAVNNNLQADIVVIGAGGAGMTAAIQAKQDGATNVVIVEKMPQVGGNTTRATGGLNASETKYQDEQGIKDTNELFFQDTMTGGKDLNDKELVQTLVNNSAAAVDWVNKIGGDLSVVAMFGGASVERIHRPSDTSAVGPMLVKTFSKQLESLEIPVLLETTAKEITVDENGAITGVKIADKTGENVISCKAVIVATGGFGANLDMVVENDKDLAGFGSTNHAGATGEGITMATTIGAATVDMDQIQIHPTVDPETQTLYTEGVRGNGAILVNKEGNRFVNEIDTRDVVSAAILEQTENQAYLLFNTEIRDSLKAIESYIKAGLCVEADTLEELAEKTGMDVTNLKATIHKYNDAQKTEKDVLFGRSDMPVSFAKGKYYAMVCAPAIHHTMGGLKINTSSEVLNAEGKAIAGLFAAGEVTGGIHGANRLGGNAVADIVVFGRIAGSSANKYVVANGGNTEPTIKVEASNETVIPEVQGNFTDGVYEGTGTGNNGEIRVEVTVKDGNITVVKLVEHSETDGIYQGAESNVVTDIIRKQTTEVDTVTGATNTSKGIMEAVKNALSK